MVKFFAIANHSSAFAMWYVTHTLPSVAVASCIKTNMILTDLHTIAAINAKESYENLSIEFKDAFDFNK